MKRLFALFLLVSLLSGCTTESNLGNVMAFRERLLASDGYSYYADITADYGDEIYHFGLQCSFDKSGCMEFEVFSPETISGITGSVSHDRGFLTFDDQALLFELLADEQITPICAPWLITHAMRSGYIQACGTDGEDIKVMIDDTYASEALLVNLWLSAQCVPLRAEIIWKNHRILSVDIQTFSFS